MYRGMSDPSVSDLDSLDGVFELPDGVVEDQDLRTMYEVLVARMRREAEHLPMNTVQQLLIERIAMNYIVLRQKERNPIGSKEGFAHATVQKDFNTFWLSMTKEFNALLGRTDVAMRDAILGEVRDLILRTLAQVPDSEVREDIKARFAMAFEQNGL